MVFCNRQRHRQRSILGCDVNGSSLDDDVLVKQLLIAIRLWLNGVHAGWPGRCWSR